MSCRSAGPASCPQIGTLMARWVHRLERLVEPTHHTAGGMAVWLGLHQPPARAVVRGVRVVTLVDRPHRGEHRLVRGRSGHTNQVVPVSAGV